MCLCPINTHYYFVRRLFFLKKNRRRPHTCLTQGFVCQDSCACTRFLCMHKILVHAQHSCACTTLLCMHWRGQGPRPGPKKKQPPRVGPCTRILCMHKNLDLFDKFSNLFLDTSWYVLIRFFQLCLGTSGYVFSNFFLVRLGTSWYVFSYFCLGTSWYVLILCHVFICLFIHVSIYIGYCIGY